MLLCADFPFSLVRNAARITTEVPPPASSASGTTKSSPSSPAPTPTPPPPHMSFRDFSHKLFVLFFFSEFLNQCALSFRSLDASGSGRVSRDAFRTRLHEVVSKRRHEFSCPHTSAIDDALRTSPVAAVDQNAGGASPPAAVGDEIMFNTFCVELFAHDKIHRALDVDDAEATR